MGDGSLAIPPPPRNDPRLILGRPASRTHAGGALNEMRCPAGPTSSFPLRARSSSRGSCDCRRHPGRRHRQRPYGDSLQRLRAVDVEKRSWAADILFCNCFSVRSEDVCTKWDFCLRISIVSSLVCSVVSQGAVQWDARVPVAGTGGKWTLR